MTLNSKIDADTVLARVLKEGPDALLTRGEAAALVASRVEDERDTERTARKRVATQLDRASERGHDPHHGGLARMADGHYLVHEIAYWAHRQYPGLFEDLPSRPREISMTWNEKLGLAGSTHGDVTPGDVEGCVVLIKQLREQIKQREMEGRRSEIERKRQLADNLRRKKSK